MTNKYLEKIAANWDKIDDAMVKLHLPQNAASLNKSKVFKGSSPDLLENRWRLTDALDKKFKEVHGRHAIRDAERVSDTKAINSAASHEDRMDAIDSYIDRGTKRLRDQKRDSVQSKKLSDSYGTMLSRIVRDM